jgi:hypothetical protein
MADDAIQKDVSETKEDVLSAQQSELERIAEKVGEGHETYDDDYREDEPTRDEPLSPLLRKDDEWYVSAKVDGQEVEIPYGDVLAQYQKNSSADKRLQEAAERQRELGEYEAKLNAYRAQLEAQPSQPSSDAGEDVSPSDSDATDALYGQYHDALFQGDEAKANQMLKQIRAAEKPKDQSIDVKSIIERTKAEMREEEKTAREQGYEVRRQEAVKMFHDEFPEIVGDPSLLAVADRRSAELYQDDPTRDPWEIMQECGSYAKDWLFKYVEQLGGKDGKGRQQRKQDMDEVAPVNARAHIGEDETEPTYSDIITEMRQQRGQLA